jgi:ferrochelatase
VVILNFGGPRNKEEVESFLFQLFDDPDVIKLPVGGPRVQRLFARRLSRSRTPKIQAQYEQIGYSPLIPTTERQVEAIRGALTRRLGSPPKIYLGMRYTEPTMAQVVAEIARDKPDRLVALSLYPHWSGTTTGSSFNRFSEEMERAGLGRLPVRYIPAFYDHPRYVAAMAARIGEATPKLKDRDRAHLLFSAHGLPSAYVLAGDPYPSQVRDSVKIIARAIGWTGGFTLSFQSKVGPAHWLEPSTEQEIHRLADAGVKEVLIVPVSFVSEHIETLFEIDVTFREFAAAHGVELIRMPALDEHPDFIECLAELIAHGLADDTYRGIGAFSCVRCLLPKPHAHRMRVQCPDCGHETPPYLLRLPPVKEHG